MMFWHLPWRPPYPPKHPGAARPERRGGPDRVHLRRQERSEFRALERAYWAGRSGRRLQLQRRSILARAWLAVFGRELLALLALTATIVGALRGPLFALPGVLVLGGWLLWLLRMRRRSRLLPIPGDP